MLVEGNSENQNLQKALEKVLAIIGAVGMRKVKEKEEPTCSEGLSEATTKSEHFENLTNRFQAKWGNYHKNPFTKKQ